MPCVLRLNDRANVRSVSINPHPRTFAREGKLGPGLIPANRTGLRTLLAGSLARLFVPFGFPWCLLSYPYNGPFSTANTPLMSVGRTPITFAACPSTPPNNLPTHFAAGGAVFCNSLSRASA